MSSNEPGRRIAASIGVARPTDHDKYGYLSEHHTYGQTEQEAGDYAEDLAATMLATTLGISFDAEKDYNERKEQYMMGGEIVDTHQHHRGRDRRTRRRVDDGHRAAILI